MNVRSYKNLLQAEIEKYKSLRDIYADKYAKDQSATNLSYLKSYNSYRIADQFIYFTN